MDSYSGRFPLDLISLYLDMTSRELNDSDPTQTIRNLEEGLTATDGVQCSSKLAVPNSHVEKPAEQALTPTSASSGSATESLSAYAERTVNSILARGGAGIVSPSEDTTELEIRATESVGLVANTAINATTSQLSVEEREFPAIERRKDPEDVIPPAAKVPVLDPTEYFSDTSEAVELMDSSGVGGPVFSLNKKTPTIVKVPAQGEDTTTDNESLQEAQGLIQGQASGSRQLSASGRVLLRKYFVEKDPIELPRGHPTIALTEGQMHTVLKTISDETILSSFHLMKSLLLQATSGKVLTKERCRHVGQSKGSPKGHLSSSGDESTDADSSKGGYTSGALNTDDEPGSLSFCLDREEDNAQHGTTTQVEHHTTIFDPAHETIPSPGSAYSLGDYAPLSTLVSKSGKAGAGKSPPRKRRRYAGRPGKVMKEAYFKGIAWTKVFVTGPLDPGHNQYKFYCKICKTNVSIRSKGAREIVRHYQPESHLRKDQLWRYTHLSRKNEITGTVIHQVRGRNGVVLTPLELEKEKPLFEGAPLVDIGGDFPFYDDYLARTEGRLTTTDARDSTQIALISTMVPYTGDMNLLHAFWTQVGAYMNHQEAFAPFDWGPSKLTVRFLPTSGNCSVTNAGFISSFCLGDFPPYLHLWNGRSVKSHCC